MSLVMLTARTTALAPVVYNAVARHHPIAAVLVEEPVSRARLLTRRVRRLGLPTVAGQVLFQALAAPVLARRARERLREIHAEYALDETPIPAAAITRVPSMNSAEARALLAVLAPRVVLVFGTRILAPETLAAVDARFINLHAGITPLYRGVHGGYWALHDGHPEHFGATVHLVDPGIDTGAILAQVYVTPAPRDDFATYPLLQTAAALPALVDVVGQVLAGGPAPPGAAATHGAAESRSAPAGPSRLRSHPTLGGYLRARVGRGVK
jgi:folate-dependent phosphoribosylglycinamide formyltransferase PurN